MMIIKHRIQDIARIVLDRTKAANYSLKIRPSDVFITSYPRSGNTWMRFIIANLIHPNRKIDLTNIEELIPDIYKKSNYRLLEQSSPRYLKSHEAFNPRYPKVIYIVRDIRSVIVSYYKYRGRKSQAIRKMSLNQFSRELFQNRLDDFGTWDENVNSWINAVGDKPSKFLLIKYEDLKENGLYTISKVCEFLELNKSESDIKQALENSRFEKLKKIEQQQWNDWSENKKVSSMKPFFRSGSTNEWHSELDKQTLEYIYSQCEGLMNDLGYTASQ